MKRRFVALIVLDGWGYREETEANARTPILFVHGTRDPMVPVARGRAAHESHPGANRTFHEFPMGHEICDEEVALLKRWLGERFREPELRSRDTEEPA